MPKTTLGSLLATITYTGTEGPGMTAKIHDAGSRGLSVEMPDGWGEWKDVRRYLVIGPKTNYDAIIALNIGGFGVNSYHPYIGNITGGTMRALDKVEPGDTGWTVEVVYSRPPMGIWGDTAVLLRPLVVNYSFSFLRKPTEMDSQGYVVVNSSGDLFDPPQSIDIALLKIRCRKWLSSYSYANASSLVGTVNASAVTLSILGNVAARTLKCLNYAPANDIIPNAPFVFTSFDFELMLDKYDRRLIDRGFRAWYSTTKSSTKKGKISARSNLEPIPQAVLLNGTGGPLLPDYVVVRDDKDGFSSFASAPSSQLPAYLTAVRGADGNGGFYLPYRIEKEADFGTFATIGL
ncbi:MAG: hypothetical protein FWD61_11975 [Phycisphaerales bacterium]|nr:hypothetical protein [Phycisphaerales bacterium]